ncbi:MULTISPECIES: hypothetical protein [Streptomyces]|uniref:hypothetical protein n=1 Tax=Streptomyces TaxID=1883 RepID=UPI0013722055|nr:MULTISPECIES: hypothetical protein [Streptomyces]
MPLQRRFTGVDARAGSGSLGGVETALAAAHDASRSLIDRFEGSEECEESTAADGPGSLFPRG